MVRLASLAVSGLALFTRIASAVATQKDVESPEFATFSVPEHPHHAIRIKEQSDELCDAGSRQWTGWLDTGGKHLFFWYFESLNDPQKDPLSLWMTGGPGGSGLVGLMLELGPCLINENGTGTVHNPHAWNSNSSMIFVDQPAGTGLSYSDKDVTPPATSYTAAEDMNIFLRIFYKAFLHLDALPFHIVGESYGGHYIPALGAEIIRYNTGSPAPAFKVPLASVMIGNGYVSPADTTWGFYETLCTTKPGVPEPVFNVTSCASIAAALPRCMYLEEACYKYPDPIICRAAGDFCFDRIDWLYYQDVKKGGRNPFDITRPCEVENICYGAGSAIETYINSDRVRAALEVPDEANGGGGGGGRKNFTLISEDVNRAFELAGDMFLSTEAQVRYLLESGVDVLVYNGDLDLACNSAGNARWTDKLSWAGQVEFSTSGMEPWFAVRDGERVRAGRWKQVAKPAVRAGAGGRRTRFAFVTVEASGHMVPLDQPEVGLQMVRNWLFGDFGEAVGVAVEVGLADEDEYVFVEL
ncbi:Putative peptidase S10, serine carboxypeptidase, serine carboxypeptidase, serine active [Colletotrichum destructivum]|uniref:Carboxypeptidase n=1 Tax=Colletotrichum destructivum TaxID=34406 RepID=A0AAX4IIR6_9PEZI|nr:Putative peptidase S10, serine carboxypeptidase, serine carboxypeptidase, serine active [Colletotrichum destructivum]